MIEDRPSMNECVKLPVFSAWVNAGGQVCQQRLVKRSSDKRAIQKLGIYAHENRFESSLEKAIGHLTRVPLPDGEYGLHAYLR
jgi:hypothetical protein